MDRVERTGSRTQRRSEAGDLAHRRHRHSLRSRHKTSQASTASHCATAVSVGRELGWNWTVLVLRWTLPTFAPAPPRACSRQATAAATAMRAGRAVRPAQTHRLSRRHHRRHPRLGCNCETTPLLRGSPPLPIPIPPLPRALIRPTATLAMCGHPGTHASAPRSATRRARLCLAYHTPAAAPARDCSSRAASRVCLGWISRNGC